MILAVEVITANLRPKTRRVMLNGREHIAAPVTMMVPTVLNGSQGPLFYPASEFNRDPGAWNHMPIVLSHPRNAQGKPVSARSLDVLNERQLGVVLNTRGGSKLRATAYFDVERTRKISPKTLNRLERGESFELSTGLFTDNEVRQGVHNGKNYHAVARNYRPDHLAVFENETGACSRKDGCGVNVNEDPTQNNCGIGADGFQSGNKCAGGGKAGSGKKLTIVGAAKALAAKGYTLEKGLPFDMKSKTARYQVRSPDGSSKAMTSKEIKSILSHNALEANNCGIGAGGFQPGNKCAAGGGGGSGGGSAKGSQHDARLSMTEVHADLRRTGIKTRTEADGTLRLPKTESSSVGVAQSLGEHGWKHTNQEQSLALGQREIFMTKGSSGKRNISISAGEYGVRGASIRPWQPPVTNQQEGAMPKLNDKQRKRIVDSLIANCECGGAKMFSEADREVLNAKKDEELMTMEQCRSKMKMAANMAGAFGDGLEVNGSVLTFNMETGEFEASEAEAGGEEPEPKAPAKVKSKKEKEVKTNQQGAEPAKPRSVQEYLSEMPAEIRSVVTNALKWEQDQKEELIAAIVANELITFTEEYLKSKDVEELQAIAALAAPTQNQGMQRFTRRPNYAGAAGGQVQNEDKDFDTSKDVLSMPTINWNEPVEGDRKKA